MLFPHNGNIVTIDQLTYNVPQSQTTISSMSGKNTIPNLTDVSPGVYQDSMLLGAYCGPSPTSFKPISSSVFMLKESWAIIK